MVMEYIQFWFPLLLVPYVLTQSPDVYRERAIRQVADASNHLALNIYKELSKEGKNVFISPLSLSTALAMLYYGARGQTAREMRNALGYNAANLSDRQLHQSYQALLTELSKTPDEYILDIANSILTQKEFGILPEYKENVQKIYQASALDVDFGREGPKVVAEINQWVRQKTRNKIQKLLDKLDPRTRLVLLSAVYFKGTWLTQFETRWTRPGKFYNGGLSTSTTEVPFMHMKKELRYGKLDDAQVLELPYKGNDISMLILLPDEQSSLVQLERKLLSNSIQSIRSNLFEKEIEVSLPKFKLEYSKQLSGVLQKIGMASAFGNADLSGINGRKNLVVSQVLHKAVVEVNEEGSEAAGVTGVIMVLKSARFLPRFKADRPFVFAIVDKRNDMILFLGRVNEL